MDTLSYINKVSTSDYSYNKSFGGQSKPNSFNYVNNVTQSDEIIINSKQTKNKKSSNKLIAVGTSIALVTTAIVGIISCKRKNLESIFNNIFKKDIKNSSKVEPKKDTILASKISDKIKTTEKTQKIKINAEVKPEVKTDAKVEVKPEVKTDAKVEVKPEVKTDAKVEVKPEVKTDAKVEVKPEVKTDAKVEVKPEVKTDAKVEILKKQLDSELKQLETDIPNLSRYELAKRVYELNPSFGEISKLKKLSSKGSLTEAEQLKLNFYEKEFNMITEREREIEKSLKPFHPVDTVSATSAISDHHGVMGYNQSIRAVVENNTEELDKNEIEKILTKISKLDKDFEKLPPLEHDCIVYKGVSENPIFERYNKAFKIMENAKVGDVVVPDKAYTYTAFERTMAENWGGEGARSCLVGESGKNRVMMYEIHLPKGSKVSRNMEHKGEVLMPRGAEYKIIEKNIHDNGDIEVTLEYLIP